MPRERITSNGTPDSHEVFDLQVGWSPGQYVQVGIQVSDPDQSIVDILFGGEGGHLSTVGTSLLQQFAALGWKIVPDPDAKTGAPVPVWNSATGSAEDHAQVVGSWAGLGQAVLNALNGARDFVERDGLWVDLRRDEANKAVRFIRKARDAAYGKDE